MENKEKVIAVVPVRGGSERVPHKNIRSFAGSSLLAICITKLKQLKGLDEIIVDSDCDEMLELAVQMGVTARKRPNELATSITKPQELSAYIAEATHADWIFYVHCTSPLVSVKTMQQFLGSGITKDYDSLNSGSLVKKHLWLNGKPLNYNADYRPNTQQLPDIVALNYALNLIRRSDMKHRADFIGVNPRFFILPESEDLDIDTMADFILAEQLYHER